MDRRGHVKEKDTAKKLFHKKSLTARGELPTAFALHKHNFNAHEIRGDLPVGANGVPIVEEKNERGEWVDRRGRRVNKCGLLVDEKGSVMSGEEGKKKFDRKQLTKDGDVPRLYNFEGTRFALADVVGEFERDAETGKIVLVTSMGGRTVDVRGRLVNEKGYLVDEEGNVVDRRDRRIFAKEHLFAGGEIPKVLPYTKFDPSTVTGDVEKDALGNALVPHREKDGKLYDRNGDLINAKGLLVNERGDVVDKGGFKVFDAAWLDETGDLPPVFRMGLLRTDSAGSFSELLKDDYESAFELDENLIN